MPRTGGTGGTSRTRAKAKSRTLPVRKDPTRKHLLSEVRALILEARAGVARTVNVGLTLLYWEIGNRIRQEILQEKRAEYGQEIVSALSRQLEAEFGRGFSRRNLFNMIRFAEVFPDLKIVQALIA